MEKRLYTAAEVSKGIPAAFFLKLFDRDVLLKRLDVVYGCNDPDDLPKQELADRWLRMLSADRLRELADKITSQLMQFGDFDDDVTDAIDDTLLDAVTKNAVPAAMALTARARKNSVGIKRTQIRASVMGIARMIYRISSRGDTRTKYAALNSVSLQA